MEALFWTSLACVAYTYFGYPLMLWIWSRVKKGKPNIAPKEEFAPSVTLVISLYNEEECLSAKIENLKRINYPGGFQIMFGSDGSNDRSVEILQSARLKNSVVRAETIRKGKASMLNALVPQADGEIVVFSDANTEYQPETIEMLVRHFSDAGVGCVCGELVLRTNDSTAGGLGEGSYWHYENKLKQWESDIHTTVGATGGVYAIRRNLFIPLPERKVVTDDFLNALNVIKQGYRIVYEPTAKAYEDAPNSVEGEFQRRVRIGTANLYGISEFKQLLNPVKGFVALALWSRKLLRWTVPLFLIAILVSSAVLARESATFGAVFIGELVFVAAALIGFLLEKMGAKTGILGLPSYFVAVNAALLVGMLRFLLHRQKPTWEAVR